MGLARNPPFPPGLEFVFGRFTHRPNTAALAHMATRTDRARPSVTILVVENDHATRTRHRDALVAAGYQAIAIEDGIGALLYLDSHPAPDAVILDLQLPRVPGLVVYEDLRARKTTRTTPIIVLTGTEGPQFEPRDIIVLRKPIDEGVLVAAVIAALGETRSNSV